ncbi:MAG: endopeptidase La [Lachnospiraceae bacterium]|nr:endopeptidase La [Lachnospiraceae bacterium]
MEDTILIATVEMPAVALRGLCILPGMIIHFDLSREKSIRAVEKAMLGEQKLFLVAQRDENTEDPGKDELYQIGTIAGLKQISRLPGGIVRVLVEGVDRGKLWNLDEGGQDYLLAQVEALKEDASELDEVHKEAICRELRELFHAYSRLNPGRGKMLDRKVDTISRPGILMDTITSGMLLPVATKQKILAAVSLKERYECLSSVLNSEIQIGMVRKELTGKIQKKVEKNQKDYLLREQMSAIREELGEKDTFSEAEQYEEALHKLKAGKEVKEKIKKEIARFKSLSASSSESAVERTYIETLLEMPWDKVSKDNTDMKQAEQILKADHYGMEQIKERILEFLAVRSLLGSKGKNERGDSPIICLVGPPGTGKTSIARSLARALKKEYVRISLGGVRDEAEIRGHRKTYVGAMPGRIAAGLKQAGVGNPLMLLDEIDKVGSDYKGDTGAALLEVLDSEQNCRFRDHYIELPLDLSQVFFVATANSTAGIPKPLLDRMELIEVNSYTENEKFHIAKEYLFRKVSGKNGLLEGQLTISDGAIRAVISGYTKEAGVRNLERKLGEICRKAARELVKKEPKQRSKTCIRVTAQNLEKYLGKVRYTRNKANETDEAGIVRGLAWTSVGGETLQIEVNKMPGKGEVKLTGQMGDVMKESAMTGLSYVRSISEDYQIPANIFQEMDFHIHIPEGAVPKDGPSAGITMATALLSALTGKKVRADVAMTGEITLRGRVLPIGGLKEKLLAARMADIKRVLVPKENKKDVEEISEEIKSGMEICFVERMEEVLKLAFAEEGSRDDH